MGHRWLLGGAGEKDGDCTQSDSSWHLEEEAVGMSLVPAGCGGCSERRMSEEVGF